MQNITPASNHNEAEVPDAASSTKAEIRANAQLSDELAAYLEQGSFTQLFTVERVLSNPVGSSANAAAETTTLIRCPSGELRVRKAFDPSSTLADPYALLHDAQSHGRCRTGFPRVLALHDSNTERIVELEYIKGPTLGERIDACRDQNERLALAFETFGPLCRVTHELHTAFEPPLIHRDIKPSNVIAPKVGTITLIDFGIARVYNPASETDTVHLGTRSYAPPEQFGFGQTTVRSDVYSLGATLFHLLVGHEVVAADRTDAFAAVEDPALRGIVSRACAFDPQSRYASSLDLERAFEKIAKRKRVELKAQKRKVIQRTDKFKGQEQKAITHPIEVAHPQATRRFNLSRILGRLWNACVILAMGITAMGCFYALEGDYRYPLWLRVVIYLVFTLPSLALGLYAFLDKRRRRVHIPIVSQLSWWQESLLWISLSIALFFIAVIFESIGHWLWPM